MIKEKILMGKKSRKSGKAFELKVRHDLESKGWIVCRWSNNVDIPNNKLIPAKHKFNPFTKAMSAGNGFPDFIIYRLSQDNVDIISKAKKYEVISVESKMNGKLDKIEKEKCNWYLKNNMFGKIWIASKGKKRGEIIYTEYRPKEENENDS